MRSIEPCNCGDTDCWTCGNKQGTRHQTRPHKVIHADGIRIGYFSGIGREQHSQEALKNHIINHHKSAYIKEEQLWSQTPRQFSSKKRSRATPASAEESLNAPPADAENESIAQNVSPEKNTGPPATNKLWGSYNGDRLRTRQNRRKSYFRNHRNSTSPQNNQNHKGGNMENQKEQPAFRVILEMQSNGDIITETHIKGSLSDLCVLIARLECLKKELVESLQEKIIGIRTKQKWKSAINANFTKDFYHKATEYTYAKNVATKSTHQRKKENTLNTANTNTKSARKYLAQ